TEERLAAAPRGVLTEWAKETRDRAGGLPLYYTEWNTSSSCRDPRHDEPYAAAFALKTIADNDGLVNGYSFWTFSDVFEEQGLASRPFHGGFGLLTLHEVEKPAYQAFRFLHEAGNERLPVTGEGGATEAMAVTRGPATHVLLWNYDAPGSGIETARVELAVTGADRPLRATLERVDADHANPKAAWDGMGRPHYPAPAQVEQLKDAAAIAPEELNVSGQAEQCVELSLPPYGVARVTLEPLGP
ncbi:MAG: GH39 family glycosyl hydrolase, partial [Planctomycetota bacterium]